MDESLSFDPSTATLEAFDPGTAELDAPATPLGRVTSYGFQKDKYGDSASLGRGKFSVPTGSFDNQLRDTSFAASPDIEQQMKAAGIAPMQPVRLKFSDGSEDVKTWDDRTAQDAQILAGKVPGVNKPLRGRFDFYSPSGVHPRDQMQVVGFSPANAATSRPNDPIGGTADAPILDSQDAREELRQWGQMPQATKDPQIAARIATLKQYLANPQPMAATPPTDMGAKIGAFDPSTARPAEASFDPSTARPVVPTAQPAATASEFQTPKYVNAEGEPDPSAKPYQVEKAPWYSGLGATADPLGTAGIDNPEAANAATLKTFQEPYVNIPKPEATSIGAGIARGAISTAEGLETPENATIIAGSALMPPVVQKLIAMGFGGQMMLAAPDEIQAARDAKTPGEAAEHWTRAALSFIGGGTIASHAGARAPEGGAGERATAAPPPEAPGTAAPDTAPDGPDIPPEKVAPQWFGSQAPGGTEYSSQFAPQHVAKTFYDRVRAAGKESPEDALFEPVLTHPDTEITPELLKGIAEDAQKRGIDLSDLLQSKPIERTISGAEEQSGGEESGTPAGQIAKAWDEGLAGTDAVGELHKDPLAKIMLTEALKTGNANPNLASYGSLRDVGLVDEGGRLTDKGRDTLAKALGFTDAADFEKQTFKPNENTPIPETAPAENRGASRVPPARPADSNGSDANSLPLPAYEAEIPTGLGTGVAPEKASSVKNAATDIDRTAQALQPAGEHVRRPWPQVDAEARQRLTENPQSADTLIAELAQAPRQVSDTESAMLAYRWEQSKRALESANQAVNDLYEQGDAPALEAAKKTREEAEKKAQELADVLRAVGTKAGQGLAARKMFNAEDWSLAQMQKNYRAQAGGRPLTQEETAFVNLQHAKIQDALSAVEKHESSRSDAESADALGQELVKIFKEAQTEGQASRPSLVRKVANTLKGKANEARARIAQRTKEMAEGKRLLAGLDPEELNDLAIIGASHIAEGAARLTEFGARMVKEFGDRIKPHLRSIYDESKKRLLDEAQEAQKAAPKDTLSKLKARVDDGGDISRAYVRKLAKDFIASGIEKREELLDAVHGALEGVKPGISRRETMDLLSGYGEMKALPKDDVSVKLRGMTGELQQIAKIQDMQAGEAPKKTGIERRTPTDEERRLLKEVEELKRTGKFQVTDPATQLKTALDAVKTRIKNEIRDLAERIDTGRKPPGRSPIERDVEAESLTALRDKLKETLRGIEDAPERTDAQKIAAAEKALESSVKEYERRIRVEDTRPRGPTEQAWSPKIAALRARRNALRAEYDELKTLKDEIEGATEAKKVKAVEAQIAELDRRLSEGDIAPKAKPAQQMSPERERLVSMRDAMQRQLSEMRRSPRKPQEVIREEQLKKQIAALDAKLQAGDISTNGRTAPSDTAGNEYLREQRNAMQRQLQEMRKAAKPQLSPEARALAAWKTRVSRQIEQLHDRMARQDFGPRPKKAPPALDPEGTRLRAEAELAKREYSEGALRHMLKSRTVPQKVFGTVKEGINTARAVMTSIDLSAVLRQGGFISFGHPLRSLKAFPAMLKAMLSEKRQAIVEQEIRERPNAQLYKDAKLYLAEEGTSLSKMEEAYMSRWAKKIPLVAASERAYTTFLNRLRADSFDAMEASLTRRGKASLEEARAIANFINVATGRGDLGKYAAAGQNLSTVFFAPRYVLSRFQLLAGQPLFRANSVRGRAMIAGEYARYLAGAAVVTGLGMLAGGTMSSDSTSPDFGKLKFGNTRIDPFSGLSQSTVFLSREGRALARFFTGDKSKPPKYGTGGDVLGRFLRSKLSPAIGSIVDAVSGKNVVGQPVTPAGVAARAVVPLSIGDVYDALKGQDVPHGVALSLLAIFGMGVQNYEAKPRR